MIENLIEPGSVLFWTLFFVGVYLTTTLADKRTSLLLTILSGLATVFVTLGLTGYHPREPEFAMAMVAYLLIGIGFSIIKWMMIVQDIRSFVSSMDVTLPSETISYLVYEKFKPADTDTESLTLPPDPREFKTRIILWFLFWPCFMLLRFLTTLHTKIVESIWNKLHKLSLEVYED